MPTDQPPSPPAFKKLNPLETARLVSLLEEHFDKPSSTYRSPWSDKAIATLIPGCSHNSVGRIRAAHFGLLHRTPAAGSSLETRVAKSEARLAVLEQFAQHVCNELGIALFDFSGDT